MDECGRLQGGRDNCTTSSEIATRQEESDLSKELDLISTLNIFDEFNETERNAIIQLIDRITSR